MGLVTMTLATAIAGTTSVSYNPSATSYSYKDVWILPSDNIDRSYQTISLSFEEYYASSALEGVMQAAVLSSTEHRYDL